MSVRSVSRLGVIALSALGALLTAPITAHASGDAYSSAVVANGPAAYWRLDQVGSVLDQAGSTNGVTNGAVTVNPSGALASSTDAALRFDGTSGYVSLPSSTAVEPTSSMTVEAWIQSSSLPNLAGVIRLRCGGPDCGYAIGVFGAASGNLPFFYVIDSTGVFNQVAGTASVVDGKWHHLVGTKDASGVHLYVDGVEVGSLNYTGPVFYGSVTGFSIGRDGDDPNYYFNGSIDETAVYPAALTAAQIANHYAIATTPPPTVTPPPPPPTTGTSCASPKSGTHEGAPGSSDPGRDTKKPDHGRCVRRHGDSDQDKDKDGDHDARGSSPNDRRKDD